MSYQYILFDLDGTITESGPGIMNSARYALEQLGAAEIRTEILRRFIGPPLLESFQKYCGLTLEQAQQAIVLYRKYYTAGGMFENSVYDGVEEMLKCLKNAGKRIALATSKPEEFARQILEHFHLDGYFEQICGATMDEKRVRKDEVIAYTLKTMGIAEQEKKKILMVGDREHDILGAKKNGLASMGVLYGYGSREELEKAGADIVAKSAAQAVQMILDGDIKEKQK